MLAAQVLRFDYRQRLHRLAVFHPYNAWRVSQAIPKYIFGWQLVGIVQPSPETAV